MGEKSVAFEQKKTEEEEKVSSTSAADALLDPTDFE
jgi:hypothetical protein